MNTFNFHLYYLLFCIAIIFPFAVQSQEMKIIDMIEKGRKAGNVELDEAIVKEGNPTEILKALKNYDNDAQKEIRFAALMLEYQTAYYHRVQAIHREVVQRLVNHSSDKELMISQQASRLLLNFSEKDFSKQAKSAMIDLLRQQELSSEIILSVGIAQIESEIPFLKQLTQTDSLSQKDKYWFGGIAWPCHLALARMGNIESTNYCIQKVESESNSILRVTRLLKDVSYIRNAKSINLLKTYLFSEQRLPPVEEPFEGTKYVQYVMTYLAESLENFPIPIKGTGYTDQEVALARTWIQNNPTYKIKR